VPEARDVNIGGNSSATIGSFTTAGTFKLYCTVHTGMNLTVIVQ
jgi:plastocyanin